MKKILSVIVSVVAALGIGFPTYAADAADYSGVQRTIIQVKNATVINPAVPANTIDPDHQLMLNIVSPTTGLPVYTQEDVNQLEAKAKAHILALTGFDISTAIRLPNGLFLMADKNGVNNIIVARFSIGGDDLYNLLYDSNKNGIWTVRNNSIIVQFQAAGTFPGGTLKDKSYKALDIISWGFTDHLRVEKDWNNLNANREQFIVYTTRPGGTVVNHFSRQEFHVPLRYETVPVPGQYDNVAGKKIGYGSDNTYVEVEGPAGAGQATRSITQHVITFFAQDNP